MLWKELASIMDSFPGDKEKKCFMYISNMLQLILSRFSNNLLFDVEYFVQDMQFGGELDMVIHAKTPTRIPVVYIVDANV
jgi:hypothetical protein